MGDVSANTWSSRVSSATQSYAYVHASAVRETPAGRSLALETSSGATPDGEAANARFFDGS